MEEILKKYFLTVAVILILSFGVSGAFLAFDNSRSLGQGIEDNKIFLKVADNCCEFYSNEDLIFKIKTKL